MAGVCEDLAPHLQKRRNGFMHGGRNATFLGKEARVRRYFGVAKQVGRLNVNLALLLFYTDPPDWKNTGQFNKHLLLGRESGGAGGFSLLLQSVKWERDRTGRRPLRFALRVPY